MEQPQSTEHRLAAILSADVQGYSRLMAEDESATVRTLNAFREVMAEAVRRHRGRVVDTPGDNLLAEFPSAIDAAECAIEVQSALAERNGGLPRNRRMEFRIGIHLGDVMAESDRIYGDGVNIAARLERLSLPGGICISRAVYEQVRNKLGVGIEDLGQQKVKNIDEPIRAYRIGRELETASTPPRQLAAAARPWWKAELVAAGALIVAAAIVALPRVAGRRESSTVAHLLPPSDKPSIAILPFANLSGDPQQDYFSNGITQDVTTDLSKLSGLFVIAHSSVAGFKGKAVDAAEVGRELGVRYVLEGSARKDSGRVRITAQLSAAASGRNLWADRFDRELNNVFAVQDEITEEIVTHLNVEVQEAELERVRRIPTDNLTAYDYYLRGFDLYNQRTKEGNARAREMLRSATRLDANYAEAYAGIGWTLFSDWVSYWNADPRVIDEALGFGRKAAALDDQLAMAHEVLAQLYLVRRLHDLALAEAERAIALDPNDEWSNFGLASVLLFLGRQGEAIPLMRKAMRLNPHYPLVDVTFLGLAYLLDRHYDEAIMTMKSAIARDPDSLPDHGNLAWAYAELGRTNEARTEAGEVMRINPQFSIDAYRRTVAPRYKDPAVFERSIVALRDAGLK